MLFLALETLLEQKALEALKNGDSEFERKLKMKRNLGFCGAWRLNEGS